MRPLSPERHERRGKQNRADAQQRQHLWPELREPRSFEEHAQNNLHVVAQRTCERCDLQRPRHALHGYSRPGEKHDRKQTEEGDKQCLLQRSCHGGDQHAEADRTHEEEASKASRQNNIYNFVEALT